ncbi:MAG: ATP-binding protein [Bacteroidetes bacterium]|nr:ATP-binding protein [Bacteroidota bacterium]
MKKHLFSMVLLCATIIITVYSQHSQTLPPFSSYVISNFTADNGLPQNTVDLVTQTTDGYIWIGTYAGLARFDGIKFIHFNKSITPAFKINHVTSLIEDKNGTVWIGTNGGGVVRYSHHAFTGINEIDGGGKEFVKTFLYDGNDNILIGTERGGIHKLVADDLGNILSVTPYTTADLSESFLLRTIVRDKLNRILLATDIGLIIIDNGRSQTLTTANGLPTNSISALAVDQNGVIWVGTPNGLVRIQDETVQTYTTANGMTSNAIRTLFVDKNNILWIGTDGGGINRFLGTSGSRTFDVLTTDDGLVNNFIRTIFQDSEDNIWIGTRNGLSQIHIRKFELFGKKAGLSDSYVRTVFEDSRKRIWVGTNGNGLNLLDSGKVKIWNSEKELPNKFIRALYENNDGTLWIGTDGGGVIQYNERKKPGAQFKRITTEHGLTENYIRAIQPGFENDVWVATYGGGISRVIGDSIIPFTVKQGLANDNVLAMVRSQKKVLWVGTNGGGINKITPGKIETIDLKNGLSNNFILSLYIDHEGVVWAGTNGGGINRITDTGVHSFTTKHGLREDVTLMIMEDNNGYLWIGGNQGITRIKKTDFQEIVDNKIQKLPKIDFGRSDGLQNAEISGVSGPCIIKSQDGKIWFTTVGGLAKVDPDRLIEETAMLPLHIEEIRIADKTVYPDSVITIDAGNNSVEFHYTSVSYIAPERIRFRYKLVGFDHDWVDAGTRRTAYYTNLPPGEYTFSVGTSTDDGTWSTHEATVSIVMEPFFYQTNYFVVLVGIGLVLIGAGLYAIRTANIHRHSRHLKMVVDERTKDLVEVKEKIEIHLQEVESARDELSRINSRLDKANKEKSDLLGILSHDFKNKVVNLNHFARTINEEPLENSVVRDHAQLMEHTTTYMLRLIEDTLSSSALEKGELVFTKARVDIVQLAELAVLKNRIQLQHKSQTIEFVSSAEKCIVSGSERWLDEAIDNLINNAGKFSHPGTIIRVSIDVGEQMVSIKIKDQGPGLTEEDKQQLFQQFKRLSAQPTGGEISTGLGLAIVQKIAVMHNGKVWAESTRGEGSTFVIELPVYRPI